MDRPEFTADVNAPEAEREAISFRSFLESSLPNIDQKIKDLTFLSSQPAVPKRYVSRPDIRIYCAGEQCNGTRTFRCFDSSAVSPPIIRFSQTLKYVCGDCHNSHKYYYISVRPDQHHLETGTAMKYGERPPLGVPVPSRLLRLFGSDSEAFLKGRACENQGLGIGAFAYYRRMVENHRNSIFDAILSACRAVEGADEVAAQIEAAKQEFSFAGAIDKIKSGLPQGLLVNGRNPLTLLHNALSIGIHSESDDRCLELAHDIRLLLADLTERIAQLKKDDAELIAAVNRLANTRQSQGKPTSRVGS